MKYNLVFVHGWGYDRNFWKPVGKLLKSNFDCNIEILDLGFFSNSNEFYFSNNSKNIFITHSYGLIWFLERNFKTDLLINFFSTPDFLSFQSEADKKKKILLLMIYNFHKSPNQVLTKFYKNCGIKSFYNPENKSMNYEKLIIALEKLKNQNFTKEFLKLDCEIFSFFGTDDKIFNPEIKKIKNLSRKNHHINFLKTNKHAEPFIEPKKICKILIRIIKEFHAKKK